MECSCVRQTDLPNTSKLFADLIYRFDRVSDLYPYAPNDADALLEASKFEFPDDRRADVVAALRPLNPGNPSLELLAQQGTFAVVTGQQVGLFSGPAYTVFKALTAIKIAEEMTARGVPTVPIFWLATEDHDFAEVNHAYVFNADQQPVRIEANAAADAVPVGGVSVAQFPIEELRAALVGLPFADEAVALVERAYTPGATMGTAFADVIRELFAPYGLLLIDPMTQALRDIAAPLMREAVKRMPELVDALQIRSKELVDRGYHAQVLVDKQTSLAFLLEDGKRLVLRRNADEFSTGKRKISRDELAAMADHLSPNALLRPVMQDYMLPTVAYVGGPAELAYLAQSRVLYEKLLGRQPVAFPRAGFTILDERSHKRMGKYHLAPTDLFQLDSVFRASIAARLVPEGLRESLASTTKTANDAIEKMAAELLRFDPSLAKALATGQRKINHQLAKIQRKTASQILKKDAQADREATMLYGLTFPERHLQERLYSIVPFYAKFGPALIRELHSAIQLDCPDHQFLVV